MHTESVIEEDVLGGNEAPRANLSRRKTKPADAAPPEAEIAPATAVAPETRAPRHRRTASEIPAIELETRTIRLFGARLEELTLGGKRRVLEYVQQMVREAEEEDARKRMMAETAKYPIAQSYR